VQALYTDTHSCLRVDGMCSDWFKVLGGVRQGCAIATDLFLALVDWIMQHTLETSSLGVNIGCQSFTDLDYADDVVLLAELLHILTHGLGVMSEEASLLGVQMNGAKTQIQCIVDIDSVPQMVHVGSSQVEVVNEFIYLESCTICDGSSESEILQRTGTAKNCMTVLEKHGA